MYIIHTHTHIHMIIHTHIYIHIIYTHINNIIHTMSYDYAHNVIILYKHIYTFMIAHPSMQYICTHACFLKLCVEICTICDANLKTCSFG